MNIPLKALLATLALSLSTVSGAVLAAGGEIAVIVKSSSSNFWQNVQKGASATIQQKKGYTMSFQGPASEAAVADQVNLVDNAVNRKVAGIVLAASDADALIPSIRKAWEAKIPVVLIDSMVSDSGKQYYQSFLATDNEAAGALIAKELIGQVGKTGKIAIMSYVAGAGSEVARVGGFTRYIQANSKLAIVGPFYSQSQMANALNQTTDVLASNPDLIGIFGANEPTAIGMARAIAQSGKAGKVTAFGFDGNQDEQGFVKDGTLHAVAVQGSFQMGALGVKTVIDVIEGKKVPKFVNTGVVLVSKKNIDLAEAKNVLY